MGITVKVDPSTKLVLSRLARALPKASLQATNDTLSDGRVAGMQSMVDAFKRVNTGYLKANVFDKATETDPVGTVLVRSNDPDFNYRLMVATNVEEQGGVEQAAWLGRTVMSIPILGKIGQGGIAALLARKNVAIFKAANGTGADGVYQRMAGDRLKLLVIFKPQTNYDPKLKWHDYVGTALQASVKPNMDRILKQLSDTPDAPVAVARTDTSSGST